MEEKEKFFIKNIKEQIVFLDIPLLFENKLQRNFNYIIYTFVAKRIQKKRVLKEKNMSEKKFNQIISKQNKLSNHQKRAKISLKLNTNKNIVKLKKKLWISYRASLLKKQSNAYNNEKEKTKFHLLETFCIDIVFLSFG